MFIYITLLDLVCAVLSDLDSSADTQLNTNLENFKECMKYFNITELYSWVHIRA